MAVVRYAALAALVIWLGAMQGALAGGTTAHVTTVAYACGAVLVVSLFAMKFVGPPPRAFFWRLGTATLMLIVATLDHWILTGTAPILINTTLGFAMLAWYAHE